MSRIGLPEGFVLPKVLVVKYEGGSWYHIMLHPDTALTASGERELLSALYRVPFLSNVTKASGEADGGECHVIKFTYCDATAEQRADFLAEMNPEYLGFVVPRAKVMREGGENNDSGRQIGTVVTLELRDRSVADQIDFTALSNLDDEVVKPQFHAYRPGGTYAGAVNFSVKSGSRDPGHLMGLIDAVADTAKLLIDTSMPFRVTDNMYYAALAGYNMDDTSLSA